MEIKVYSEQINLLGEIRLEFKSANGDFHRVGFDYLPRHHDSFDNARLRALSYLEGVKFMVEKQHPFDKQAYRHIEMAKDTLNKLGVR